MKNYYELLEVSEKASQEVIKKAYTTLVKKYHPDLNVGDTLAEERIKDINEAYKTLSIPSSKRKYDRIWNSKFAKGKKAFSSKEEKGAIFNIFLGNIDNIEKKDEINKKKNHVKGENLSLIHI